MSDEIVVIADDQFSEGERVQLERLYASCFTGYRFEEWQAASLRALVVRDKAMVWHAAASLRTVPLHGKNVFCAVLGGVCVGPASRGYRLGHMAVKRLHQELDNPFILNCGAGLVPYYEELGYAVISDQASYVRSGQVTVDHDPVLLFPNGTGTTTRRVKGPVHLAEPF